LLEETFEYDITMPTPNPWQNPRANPPSTKRTRAKDWIPADNVPRLWRLFQMLLRPLRPQWLKQVLSQPRLRRWHQEEGHP
jgi:hypothetical protein